jgi:hypothetical protein
VALPAEILDLSEPDTTALTCIQGDTLRQTWSFEDDAGAPLPIDGGGAHTIAARLYHPSTGAIAASSCIFSDAATILATWLPAVNAAISTTGLTDIGGRRWSGLRYDLEISDGTHRKTLAAGSVTLVQD